MFVLVVAACTSGGKANDDDDGFSDTTLEPVVTLTDGERDVAEAEDVWVAFWGKSDAVSKGDESSLRQVEELATGEVVELIRDRPNLDRNMSRTVENYPSVTEKSDGVMVVSDCMVWSIHAVF